MRPTLVTAVAVAALIAGYAFLRPQSSVEDFFHTRSTSAPAVSAVSSTPAAPGRLDVVSAVRLDAGSQVAGGSTPRDQNMLAEASAPAPAPTVIGPTVPANVAPPAPVAPVMQAVPVTQAAPGPAASPASAATPPAVDETALRYFARRGDTKRLAAEIARLRALYPDWVPPSDPLATPEQTDAKLDEMWRLYAEGRLAEVRSAIAARESAEPAWKVPQDLLDRLSVAEARERLVNASTLKQYETVIKVAADTPSLLTCSEVDVLWRVAEAFASTGHKDRAKDAYLYVLKSCDNTQERLATVQKAIPLLSRDQVLDLLATERTTTDGKGEFAQARLDLARNGVAAGGADPELVVAPDDIAALEAAAQTGTLASDDLLLGWYYIRREQSEKARVWFAKARSIEDTAEASQGLALALIGLDRNAEAEDVLHAWVDGGSEDVRKVYLAAVANLLAGDPPAQIAPAVLARMAPVVASARDAAAAQQFGWYARALRQHQTAGQWFATALRWKPDDEPSAYGLALTRQQLGDRAGVAEIQREWAGRSDRIATLGETRRSGRAQPVPVAPVPADPVPLEPAPERMAPAAADPLAYREPATPSGKAARVLVSADAPRRPAPARVESGSDGTVAARVARLPQRRSCRATADADGLSAEAALARAWCLLDLQRPLEAIPAFESAIRRGGSAVRRDAAWGQSLAYLRVGLANEAAVAAAKSPQDARRSADLEEALLSRRATEFFEAGRYVEALLALDQRSKVAPERVDLMLLRGYAYLNIGRKDDARRVFRAVAATGERKGLRGLNDVDPLPSTD
jgi:tetratricopeptide (TPR) repeat protein